MISVRVLFPSGDPAKRIARLAAAAELGARDAVIESGKLCAGLAKQILGDIGAVDRGIARASISSTESPAPAGYRSVVTCGAAHGVWIEYGRAGIERDPTSSPYAARAAFPPVGVLVDWVRRHVKALAPSGRTKSGRARKARQDDVKSLAFVIARAIYLRGIRPRPFMYPAFIRTAKGFAARVHRHVLRRLASVI